MYFSIPLLIVALGAMFSERSGVINIALEGTMVFGGFSGILFISLAQLNESSLSPALILIIAMAISVGSGVLVSLLHAYASINMKANQIISGTAINMFAPAVAIYAARIINNAQTGKSIKQLKFTNVFRIEKVPLLGDIPVIGQLFFQKTYITTYLGLFILFLAWLVIYKTPFGLRLRSCGEHPQAADSVGVNVYSMRYAGVMISGALAGLGGLVYIIPITNEFSATVAGYGFLALAVLIFGQWKPVRIMFVAFFFGLMLTVASTYSGIPVLKDLPVPNVIYKMIPYIATLILLAFTSRKSMAPRAEGIPYDKGSR